MSETERTISREEMRKNLSRERFAVMFEDGTEPPGSSPLLVEERPGVFVCAGCGKPLFEADKKFESGTGWPSFWAPLPDALETSSDFKLGVERMEYHCSHCGAHQGHVFEDGPRPTGLRYCNNGLALDFIPEESEV